MHLHCHFSGFTHPAASSTIIKHCPHSPLLLRPLTPLLMLSDHRVVVVFVYAQTIWPALAGLGVTVAIINFLLLSLLPDKCVVMTMLIPVRSIWPALARLAVTLAITNLLLMPLLLLFRLQDCCSDGDVDPCTEHMACPGWVGSDCCHHSAHYVVGQAVDGCQA